MIASLISQRPVKLLLDQSLPRQSAQLLRDAGVDTVHSSEIGLATADDIDILEFGRNNGRIIATLDADFHELLAHSVATAPSVIRVRIEGVKAEAMASLLRSVLVECDSDLRKGCVVTVQERRVRVRHLPLMVQR